MNKFTMLGGDGASLEPDSNTRINIHRQTWESAIAHARLHLAFDKLRQTVTDALLPVLKQAVDAFMAIGKQFNLMAGDDPKAAARARSRADVRDKRKSMMKRRGRK